MTKFIKQMKKWGYVLTIPTITGLAVYFTELNIDVQKEKNELLKQEIGFLKEKQESVSYSFAFAELDSQKKLYENKLKKINKELLKISLELVETKKVNKKQQELLKRQSYLLKEKEVLLEQISKIIFDKKLADKSNKVIKSNATISELKTNKFKDENNCSLFDSIIRLNHSFDDFCENVISIDTRKNVYTIGENVKVKIRARYGIYYNIFSLSENFLLNKVNIPISDKNLDYIMDTNGLSGYQIIVVLSAGSKNKFNEYNKVYIRKFILGHLQLANELSSKEIEQMYKNFNIKIKTIYLTNA